MTRDLREPESLHDAVVNRWGTPAQFYAELERFLKKHQNLECAIEYDNELQMPIGAVYTFPPVLVAYEHLHLMRLIHEANNKEKQDE